ncbi:hypothetical protein [Urechidicola sp. KH5]
MKIRKVCFMLGLGFVILSCSNDSEMVNDNDNLGIEENILPSNYKEITFEKNTNLNGRITYFSNSYILPEIETKEEDRTFLNQVTSRNDSGSYEIIAQVNNPTVNGYYLSATSIEYGDNHDKIYVTYHTKGAPIYGAIEVYDVQDLTNPTLQASYTSTNLEFNDIHISVGPSNNRQNKLYTAGNTDIDNNSFYSIYHRFNLNSGGEISFEGNGMKPKYLDYGTASSVMKYDSYVFLASAGDNGLIYPIRKNFSGGYGSRTWVTPGSALKFLDNYRGKMAILTNGVFYLTDVRNNPLNYLNNFYWSESFPSFSPENGKNTIKIDHEKIYIAAGLNGIHQYTYDTEGVTLDFTSKSASYNTISNCVDADSKYVYAANSSKLTIYKKSNPSELYHYNFGDGSVNYVKAFKDLLFVAAGTDGIYILNKGELEDNSNVIPNANFQVFNGIPNPNQYKLVVSKSITGGSSKIHISSQILTPNQSTATKYIYIIANNQLNTSDIIYFGEQTRTSAEFSWDGTFSN